MDVGFSADQEEIRATAREMLARRAPLTSLATVADEGRYDAALWQEIVALGWPGVAVPEQYGGLGSGAVELTILAEELGYAVAASPFISVATAITLIDNAGTDAQRGGWLQRLVAGEATATAALAASGRSELVPDAIGAAALVLVDGDRTASLVRADEASVEAVATIDPCGFYAEVAAGGGEPLSGDVAAAVDRVEVLLAAHLVGISQRALDLTVAFVAERQQFGSPVGAFQAVSHRCAEILLETERARSCVYLAAWSADSDPDRLPYAASLAKAAAVRAAAFATSAAIQLHGAVGFTWEADVHWLFKRARMVSAQFEAAAAHLSRAARLAAS